MHTETLTVLRSDDDRYGNTNEQDIGTVQGVLSWGTVTPSTPESGRGESASTGAELFVSKGTDLRATDRVKRANGATFRVVGSAQWDQPHPLSGRSFSRVVYRLEYIAG